MPRIALILVMVALACGLAVEPARAKDHYFTRVQIQTRVNPDGSLAVTERRTFRFNGSFSWATYTLERRGWDAIADIGVADEQGRYAAAATGAPRTYQVATSQRDVEVKWHFAAEDEEKTFIISYRVTGAVTRYRDTAELYWRFIGTGWDVPTLEALITVSIPGTARTDLRAWGHGPLNGVVTLGDGTVTLQVDQLDPETFVEGRILFPAAVVPAARLTDNVALPRILAEEARFARAANLLRLTVPLNILVFPLALLVALGVWFVLYLRYGKEYRIRLEQPYLREPPAPYGPAVLGGLLRWGKPAAHDFGATILDLARRGFLKVQQEGGDRPVYRFVRAERPDTGLAPSEQQALALLFRWGAGQKSITDAEFKSAAWRQGDAARLFRNWQGAVETETRAQGFFDNQSRRLQDRLGAVRLAISLGGIALTIAVIAVFRLWLVTGFMAFPLAAGAVGMLQGPLARRTEKGATHLAQWRAFRRFLRDFSTLEDAPPPAITVWESYLPYAVTLGVAGRVIRQFPRVYGEAAARTVAPSWYVSTRGLSTSGGGSPLGAVTAMTWGLSRTLAWSTTPRSSSSGSGGGFSRSSSSSGGGSRGGGGSGGRAG
jgi:uncharacterized membrane protein